MKLKVLKAFHDKDTDELYQIGSTLDVTNERGKELLAHPSSLVSEIKEEKPKTSKAKTTKKTK